MSELTSMLGMGIAIQLRNMFSAPAAAIVESSRVMTDSITRDQEKSLNGWKLLGGGASMMFVGTGMLAFLGAISKASIKSSSDMEIFRLQIRLLAKDGAVGDRLFASLKTFSTTTPFTIPQVMAGARNLMSFGFGAERVLNQLKLAGDWASMMSMPIEEAAMILGKVRSGALSYAMRSLQRAGIGYADIAAAGGPVDPKTMRTMKGADPEKFLEAVNKVINKKFAGSMQLIMQTVPGMMTNMKDQMILMGATIGDGIKPEIKSILHSMLSVFNPAIILPFARAVGAGLASVLHAALLVLRPIGSMTIWFIQLANAHPGVVKLVIAMIALTGVLLNVAGASLILLGIWQIISSVLAAESTAVFVTMLSELVVPILALAAAGTILYTMFKNNFLGITDVVTHFYNEFRAVAGGLIELFSSISSGVGYMSMDTANNLQKMGLFSTVVQLFQMGYRLYQVFNGIVAGVTQVIQVLSWMAAAVVMTAKPLFELVEYGLQLVYTMTHLNLTTRVSSSVFRDLGSVIGWLVGAFAVYKSLVLLTTIGQWLWTAAVIASRLAVITFSGILFLMSGAIRVATAAQWLLNIAMDANPVGIIILGVGILVTLLVVLVTHIRSVTNGFNSMAPIGKVLVAALFPTLAIAVQMYKHWASVKLIFQDIATLVRNVLGAAFDWVSNKLSNLWNQVLKLISFAGKLVGVPLLGVAVSSGAQTLGADIKAGYNDANQAAKLAMVAVSGKNQEVLLASVHSQLVQLNAHFSGQAGQQPPLQVHLDGKQITATVNKHNKNSRVSGRGIE